MGFRQNEGLYTTTNAVFAALSSITLALVWMPQIYTTFKAKQPGALSLVMLAFTCPGAYAMIYFLAVGYHNPFYVWLPNVVGASCQTIILLMCIYFTYIPKFRAWRRGNKQEHPKLMKGPTEPAYGSIQEEVDQWIKSTNNNF